MVSARSLSVAGCFGTVTWAWLLLWAAAERAGREPVGERIFGGDDADENEFPALAYIRIYKYSPIKKRTSREYCGGSIISEKWILTSGHCLTDSHTIFVGVGSSNRTKAKYLEVERFIIHDGLRIHGRYDNNAENDLGLVKLREPLALDWVSLAAARLAPERRSAPSRRGAVVVGWGRTTYTPDKGDSGGPLLVNSQVYGVASYVDNANQDPHLDPNKHCTDAGTWAAFMSVPDYRAWIREHSGV